MHTLVTPDLVRRRAEHNEGEIFSLEELSLHQLDIERIEHLQDWCPDLKILYLQGNLVSKIENVRKLKRLIYLNLALNNIERIENLEGCEALEKLDLTLNFIWKLSDIQLLKRNCNLRELHLMGNACADFQNYRSYVAVILPNLEVLDGQEILRTERIEAKRNWVAINADILRQEQLYKPDKHGDHCPEERRRMHEEIRNARAQKQPETQVKLERKVLETTNDGRILNINQPKVPFTLQEGKDHIKLTVKIPKYMDTSLLDVDVHPMHLRVLIKGQLLQLVLPTEVRSDQSVAQRSQASGDLVVTMPTVEPIYQPKVFENRSSRGVDAEDMPALELLD